MQKTIVSDIDEKLLECKTEFSDRFIYSNYFIPLSVTFNDDKTPILPAHKKYLLREYFTVRHWVDPLDTISRLTDMGLGDLLKKNEITLSALGSNPALERDTNVRVGGRPETNLAVKDKVKTLANDMKDLTEIISSKLTESDRGFISIMNRRIDEINTSVEMASMTISPLKKIDIEKDIDRSVKELSDYERELLEALGILPNQEIEFFLNLLKSDVGYLFLDRTRIRPKGFAIGEHIYALSLAPGEEIVLEQKTFSKKQTTLEEQTEQEKQFDIELSSTLSTEIQEGFERQKNLTDSWGLNLSHTGQYSSPQFPWGSVNASHTIGYTKNVSEASQETGRRSVKDSETASSKVASKYRTLHKTTFKISTEEGFESTSKRAIRNPNKFTPINLHYFKILQRLEMTQERYGVRLCWSPFIKDPAFNFFDQIQKGKDAIIQKAQLTFPKKPEEPTPPSPPDKLPEEKKMMWSAEIEADKWSGIGLVGMRHTYQLEIPIESGYFWDGEFETIKHNLMIRTTGPLSVDNVTHKVTAYPWPRDTNLIVPVHIGAPDGGPGRHIFVQVGAQFKKNQPVTDRANEDAKYKDDLAAYRTQLKEWNDNTAKILEQAWKDADAWEQMMVKSVNPITEMINQIIQKIFPPSVRDECWEIDLWQKIFDWERASYVVYPSWWSDLPMRDPTKEPTNFFNASWARLYLPVRIGMERLALRWIFGKAVETSLAKEVEDQFDKIDKDLKAKRVEWFGSDREINLSTDTKCAELEEEFLCLARWTEVMPTDGTHIEVIQSMTSTVDDNTEKDLIDTSNLRKVLLDSEKQNLELKKKALSMITEPASVQVMVKTDTETKESP